MTYDKVINDLRNIKFRVEDDGKLDPVIDPRRLERAIIALSQCEQKLAKAKRDSFSDGWERGRMRDVSNPTIEELEERNQDLSEWQAGIAQTRTTGS